MLTAHNAWLIKLACRAATNDILTLFASLSYTLILIHISRSPGRIHAVFLDPVFISGPVKKTTFSTELLEVRILHKERKGKVHGRGDGQERGQAQTHAID